MRGCAAGSVPGLFPDPGGDGAAPPVLCRRFPPGPDEGGASPRRWKILIFAYISGRFLADAVERRRGCVNVCITPI